MKRLIRPSVPDDAPAIVALFAELGLQPNARPEDLHWKYWAARADWTPPRSYVLTSDGVVVAHAAFVPGAILTAGGRITTGHVIDWVARRGQMGAGTALMKLIGQQVSALLAFGGSDDTLRILPHIGFNGAGAVSGYARPLFPTRILNGATRVNWRLAPRLARNLAWKYAAPPLRQGGWVARELASATDVSALASCLPRTGKGTVVLERSPGLLSHALDCTILRTRLYAMERDGRTGGYFMLASAPGQVRVIDCWMDSDSPEDWRALISSAIAAARKDPAAAEVVIWASNPAQDALLRSCGFRVRFQLPLQIRMSEPDLARGPLITEGLNVQMLDNDAAFLHEGSASHWI